MFCVSGFGSGFRNAYLLETCGQRATSFKGPFLTVCVCVSFFVFCFLIKGLDCQMLNM